MRLISALVSRRKLSVTLGLLLSGIGLAAWIGMIRQEDPRLPDYWGQVTVSLPGTDAETVERLVVDPIEEELAAVAELGEIRSSALAELALFELELRPVEDPEEAWDEVEIALETARRELPDAAGTPRLDSDLQDQEAIFLALTGDPDLLALAEAAETLRDRLLELPLVSRIEIVADPDDRVVVEIDESVARRLDLTPRSLANRLAARNAILPGGSVRVGTRTIRLRPETELVDLDEIRRTPVSLSGGQAVPLGTIATVRREPEEPAKALMHHDGEPAVGLGIVPRSGINVVELGRSVREVVADQAAEMKPITVSEVAFQPDRVQARLDGLGRSLLMGVAIVAGVLFLAMGLRLGFVVASVVPLVVFSSLAVYAMGGGVLHQISVAALVIALGMLVDNAIVITEAMQWRLDRGEAPMVAAEGAVRELAIPLAAATATTLAVFVPMLLSRGPTADFTRAIPVVIMITLTVSFLFAILFTPAVGSVLLSPREPDDRGRFGTLTSRLGSLAVERPVPVVLGASLLVGLSLLATSLVPREFFPESDRNQMLVEIEMPEGTHIRTTSERTAHLEDALLRRDDVLSVTSVVGRSVPHFYYNLSQIPWSPHMAQLVVKTTSLEAVPAVLEAARARGWSDLTEAEVVARKLEQGPQVAAPVEIRLFGDDLGDLQSGAEAVAAELRRIPGAVDVRHTLGPGAPMLRFAIDDAAAARRGVARTDVALALFDRTRGATVGNLWSEDDPVPIVIRSEAGERLPIEELEAVDVGPGRDGAVPLGQVTTTRLEWGPAAVDHLRRRRLVSVLAQLAEGVPHTEVLDELRPRLESLRLPAGVSLEIGGEAEGSGDANSAMLRTLPVGILLLVAILMAEFDSFRRVGIVLVTVPLATAGVVPGLLLAGEPFGFMSFLGTIALVGVVVNNAIVLLDVVDSSRREGASVSEAVSLAVERRLRPILLTSATTIAGLLPLALSSSSLWPPLAWAMISGLAASTLLTLLVIPALYVLLFRDWPARRKGSAAAGALGLLLLSGAGVPAAQAETVELADVVAAASRRPEAEAAARLAEAAREEERTIRRRALLPGIELTAGIAEQDRETRLDTPVGSFEFGSPRRNSASLVVAQPLLEPSTLLYETPAAEVRSQGADRRALRRRRELAAAGIEIFLRVLALDGRTAAARDHVAALQARLEEARARIEAGSILESEELEIRLALERARLNLGSLRRTRKVALLDLSRVTGIRNPEPSPRLPEVPSPPPYREAVQEALERRADLADRRLSIRAGELGAKAVGAERLPRLEATAAYRWDSSTPFRDETWVEGGLRLSWRPFAAGTREPRREAARAEAASRRAETQALEAAIRIEVRQALATLEDSRQAREVARTGVELARETARVERIRFLAGRASASDLLQAEATLASERAALGTAASEVVAAWTRLELALGRDPGSGLRHRTPSTVGPGGRSETMSPAGCSSPEAPRSP